MAGLYRLIALALLALAGGAVHAQTVSWSYTGSTGGTAQSGAGCPYTKTWTASSALGVITAVFGEVKAACQPSAMYYPNYSNFACPAYVSGSGVVCTYTSTQTYSPFAVSQGTLAVTRVVTTDPSTQCAAQGKVWSAQLNQCVSQLEKDCQDRKGAGTGPVEVVGPVLSIPSSSPTTGCDTTAGDQGDTAAGMGCAMENLQLDVGWVTGNPPHWMYRMKGTFSGAACASDPAVTASTSTTPTNTPTVATPATKGKCPGGVMRIVNGLETCTSFKDYNAETVTNNVDSQTTTASDGTKTEVKNTTETKCVNGVCTSTTTTTTTTKDASGTVTGTTTAAPVVNTDGKASYCSKNPKDAQCGGAGQGGDGEGEGSSFGGSCTAGFQCDGDAAICAIAKAGNELKCALVDKVSPESSAYEAAKTTATASVSTTTTTFSAQSFDTSDFLSTPAAGLADMPLTIAGNPFVLELSKVNPWLELLGSLLMGVGFLLAARILLRG